MFCIGCGKQIKDDAKFCPFCGEDTAEPVEGEDTKTDLHISGTPAFGSAKEAEDRAAAAAMLRAEKKKRDNRIVLIAVIVIALCALAFVFYIAPKFLDVKIVPWDPFGVSGGAESDDDVDDSDKDEDAEDDGEEGKTKKEVNDEVESVAISVEGLEETDDGEGYVVMVDEVFSLKATIKPKSARKDATVEWSLTGDSRSATIDKDGTFTAIAEGEVTVKATAYIEKGKGADTKIKIIIEDPNKEEEYWPFEGTIFVTNEPKLGIFIRSEPEVTGAGNSMNDGNKIGWIAGGDESVELVCTGEKIDTGGYFWFEVEIPVSYRNSAKQKQYYDGKPLIGWVRIDVVKEKLPESNG